MKTAVPIIKETRDNEQKLDDALSQESSVLPATTKTVTRGTAKTEPNRKVRRKFSKYQIGTMSLSSNIILGVGLGMQKKKHKRRKHKKHNSIQKTSSANILLGNDLPSNPEQSVPKESFPVLVDHNIHSQEKNTLCGSDGQNQNLSMSGKDSLSSDVIINEFRERVVQNGTTVSAEKQPQKGGNSEEHHEEFRQADVVSMLTRGLDETPGKYNFKRSFNNRICRSFFSSL